MNPVRFLLPLSAVALFAVGCSKHETSAGAVRPDLPSVQVQTAAVREQPVATFTAITGTVRPVQRATIAAKVMGVIAEFPVTLGASVHAGDTLVRISADEISARVSQAEAQLNQATRDLERERALLAKNASTPDMVKNLEDRVAMTQAMVREAKVMLGYTTLTAPFDGVVARKLADAGDLAAPGMPLLDLDGTGAFEITCGIPDSQAGGLAVGTKITVNVPSAGLSFTGAIAELSSAADANAHTVPAKIAVPAGVAVRSGQFARVQIPEAPGPALLVPATAVTTLGQMDRVFVVQDNRAVLRLVKPGAKHGDLVEILAGLDRGDVVVTNPPSTLIEGQPLEVQP